MNTTAVAKRDTVEHLPQPSVSTYGVKSLTAAEIRAQVNIIQDVMHSVMQKDVHYGVIRGTVSPTLYKPGAEKILATFRLAAQPKVEDLSVNGEVHYRVRVDILNAAGQFLGAGIGECSSQEEKYAWRRPVCREEYDATPEDRRSIKWSYYQGKTEQKKRVRTNPADVRNTILKMAKKRALVDAVLTVTAASDCFSQDIEDLPPEVRAEMVEGSVDQNGASSQAEKKSELPFYSDAEFKQKFVAWEKGIKDGTTTPQRMLGKILTKHRLTEEQTKQLLAVKPETH